MRVRVESWGKEIATKMEAVLAIDQLDWEHRLRYAAEVFFESMQVADYSIRVEQSRGHNAGLHVGGGLVLPETELREMFSALSLQRELETGRTDDLGRFDEAAIQWDTSNPWIDALAQKAAGTMGHAEQAEGNGFRVFMTHDIDRTTACEPTSVLKSLLNSTGLLRRSALPLRAVSSRRSILRTIEKMLEIEARHEVGAYYFLMSGPYGMGRFSSRTDIRWRASKEVVKLLQGAGMTIGLHGSFHAKDGSTYREEKDQIEQVAECRVTCHRNHYLRFDTRRICRQLEAADIHHDFSVGFVTRLGFRAGCGRPYRLFDHAQNRGSRVREIPLLFMDSVLRGCGCKEALQDLTRALRKVKGIKGCVGLLFHPETFLIRPDVWEFFERVMEVCRELGADVSGRLPVVRCQQGVLK